MGEMQKDYLKEEFSRSATTSKIIAAALEVHRVLGHGYHDVFTQTRLDVELSSYEIGFTRKLGMDVTDQGAGLRKIRC